MTKAFWSDIANFVPGSAVMAKINNLSGTWAIQDIESATGTRINLDYFGVNIQQMPKKMNGQSYSLTELITYIRKNINQFHNQSGTSFDPISQDISLWNSTNPLASVISITIAADDGSVICSDYEDNYWVFTTLKAPGWIQGLWSPSNDGYHPVSGNRQFGIKALPNGNYEIFTKGVDRYFIPLIFTDPISNSMAKMLVYLMEKVAFLGADGLWTSFQNEITQFVSQNGGSVIGSVTEKKRPKAGDALKQLLKSNNKIIKVPCD